jgi:hypothetical protein
MFQIWNVSLFAGGVFGMQEDIPVLTELLTDSSEYRLISQSQRLIVVRRLPQNRYPLCLLSSGSPWVQSKSPTRLVPSANLACAGVRQAEPNAWFSLLLVRRFVPFHATSFTVFLNLHLQRHMCSAVVLLGTCKLHKMHNILPHD